jgi:hypothetical protein
MILVMANGNQIRGDLIQSAVLRNDLAPVPVTLEAQIRAGDAGLEKMLAVGQTLTTGSGDALRIVKAERAAGRVSQGEREVAAMQVTALLDACQSAAFVRDRAIVKENSALSAIYRAAGATLRAVDADFPIPRFCCYVGDTPTFHIARALQEEGGVVRWKNGKLQFMRLPDLFKQKPAMTIPGNAAQELDSGFLERHEVPWFLSLDESGAAVLGNQDKPRALRYSPFKNAQRLRNMTRCLVRRKKARINYNINVCAGDLVTCADGTDLTVITAAHIFASDSDAGGANNTYTQLWLGSLEQ